MVGTPHIQEIFVFLINLAVSFGENLGIKTAANLVINGACIVMHKPNPWNDGKTVSIPPPLISSGLQASISQACSATKFKLLSHKQMVLGSPVVEPLWSKTDVLSALPVTVSGTRPVGFKSFKYLKPLNEPRHLPSFLLIA